MPVLTDEQIGVCIAEANWGPGTNRDAVIKFLDVAIAIARAESGGNSTPPHNPTRDYGLWQINYKAHKGKVSPHEPTFILRMENPITCTKIARKVYEERNGTFQPWVAYVNGSYRAHLGSGKKVYEYLERLSDEEYQKVLTAMDDEPNPGIEDRIGGAIGDAAKALTGQALVQDIMGKIVAGGKTVGVFILALVIGILGIILLLRETSIGQAVKGAVSPARKLRAVTG